MTTTTLNAAVSGTIGVICLVAAALIWKVGNKHTPRLIAVLVLTGAAGMIGTPLGNWFRRAVVWFNNLLGTLAGKLVGPANVNATVVGLLIAGAALYVLFIHLRRKTIDKSTLGAAAAVRSPARSARRR
jgi:hypothetical protein